MNIKWLWIGLSVLCFGTIVQLKAFSKRPLTREPQKIMPHVAANRASVPQSNRPLRFDGDAELVTTCSNDNCGIIWSADGKTVLVQADEVDSYETKEVYFDATSHQKLRKEEGKKRFSLGWTWRDDGMTFGLGPDPQPHPLLSVCDPKGHCVPLEDTNQGRFAETQTGYHDFGWNFTAETFSSDHQEFSILIDGEVLTWNTATGRKVRHITLQLHKDRVVSVAEISRDGRSIEILPTAPHLPDVLCVAVYDTRTGRERYSLNHTGNVTASFSPDGRVLIVGESPSANGLNVWFYNAETGHLLWSWQTKLNLYPTMVPRRNEAVVLGNHGLEIYDLVTGRVKRTLKGPTSSPLQVNPSPDGSQIWASYANGQIWSFRVR